jgi:arabinogalactan endo-1,4-beta-galactosidase
MAQIIDATVFVIVQFDTSSGLLKDILAILKHNNVNLIRTIILQLNLKASCYGYGYGYGCGYGYSYEDDEAESKR